MLFARAGSNTEFLYIGFRFLHSLSASAFLAAAAIHRYASVAQAMAADHQEFNVTISPAAAAPMSASPPTLRLGVRKKKIRVMTRRLLLARSKPETENRKPETGNLKPRQGAAAGTPSRNRKPEAAKARSGSRDPQPKPETGNRKPEAAKARSGSRGPRAETGNGKPETGSRQGKERQQGTPQPKPETGNRKPEAAKATSGSRGPPAETGNRKPETEMEKNESLPKFHYFFFLWASYRRISLVFEVVPSKMHVSSSLGHHLHATAAPAAFAAAFAAWLLFLLLCCCFCC